MDILQAIIIAIIEGITEFIPVSSTGHMILASTFMGISQTDFVKSFEIIIQLGAILAVLLIYWEKLKHDFDLIKKILVAFVPTATIGFVFYKLIKTLFDASIVSYMLIIWGLIFIVLELFYRKKEFNISSLDNISYKKAFLIGVFQCFAMIPGTSRSGATIVGAMLLGINRSVASNFSFLLAIPTMFAATGYDLLKNYYLFIHNGGKDFFILLVGFIVAFFVSYIVVKWFLSFIKKHTFVLFGIYRIILGIITLKFFL